MKKTTFIFVLFTVLISYKNQAQTGKKRAETASDTSSWYSKNTVGLDFGENVFVNWSKGGVNSVSGLLKGNFYKIYNDGNLLFFNELVVRYGLNQQEGIGIRKTDDVFRLKSEVSYRRDTISNWFYSAKFSFNTQFSNGYDYANSSDFAISKPFAPAYMFLGAGGQYSRPEKGFILYLSPATMKTTIVADRSLSDAGAFGVKKAEYDADGNLIRGGETVKTGFGALASFQYTKEVMKNILLKSDLTLYSDYLHNFGNITTYWNVDIKLTVNQYIKANLVFETAYDDDIKTTKKVDGVDVPSGPRIQLKQSLGVGIAYTF